MGLFDMFRKRRNREAIYPDGMSSADVSIGSMDTASSSLGSSAPTQGDTPAGFGTAAGGPVAIGGLSGLKDLWKMGREISEAMQKGTLVSQDGSMGVVDSRGNPEMREEIIQTLREHGMDAHKGQAMQITDPKAMAAVAQVVAKYAPQMQMMQAESMKAFEQMGGASMIHQAMGAGGAAVPGLAESSADDRLAQVERLSQLHAQGVLTDAEFTAAKQRLLGA